MWNLFPLVLPAKNLSEFVLRWMLIFPSKLGSFFLGSTNLRLSSLLNMRNCFDFCFHCGCLGHNIISCCVLHTHFEFSYDSSLRADPRDSHFSSRTVSALQSSSSSSFSVSHSPSQSSLQNKQSYKNFPCSPQNHSHPDSLLLLHSTNSRLVGLSSPVPSPTPSCPTYS